MMSVVVGAGEASAHSPNNYQANLLGWLNGCGGGACAFGNRGTLAPADNLVNTIAGGLSYGFDLPGTVTTEETCFAVYGGNPSNQFNQLFSALSYVSGGTYTWFFPWVGNDDPGPDPTFCSVAGNGVIVRANNVNAKWRADATVTLHSPGGGDDHYRLMGCVYPTIWIVNWSACVTHLSTQSGLATSELNTAYAVFNTYVPAPKKFGGDFNLTGLNPPSGSVSSNVFRAPTSAFGENPYNRPNREIDYFFANGWGPPDVIATTPAPAYCNMFGGHCEWPYLNYNYISDHYWLMAFD
jgi:hypothetical protein